MCHYLAELTLPSYPTYVLRTYLTLGPLYQERDIMNSNRIGIVRFGDADRKARDVRQVMANVNC